MASLVLSFGETATTATLTFAGALTPSTRAARASTTDWTVVGTSRARPAPEALTPRIRPDRSRRYVASRGLTATSFVTLARAPGTSVGLRIGREPSLRLARVIQVRVA